jgi:Mitochondrial small ribosomal subunit Rsm22
VTWEDIDWTVLERLRGLFLSGGAAQGAYWRSAAELANYDFTYAERIGWKWDSVLRELDQRGWKPSGSAGAQADAREASARNGKLAVLDWGCGSGVAGRRVVRWLGEDRVAALRLWDHSALAADFAVEAARARFPRLAVEHMTPGFLASDAPVGVLVISHVLNELPASELLALRGLASRADAMIWVEPGTQEISRALIAVREQLRDRFRMIAPCTHQIACGLLAPGNARHWCHHFAPPPAGIFTDSNWVKFGQRAGIDLRSLPYSFLALQRGGAAPPGSTGDGFSRVLGEPRIYKGFAKLLNCDGAGVAELMLQKRDAPGLFRQMRRPAAPLIYRWTRSEQKIVGGEPLPVHPPFDCARNA